MRFYFGLNHNRNWVWVLKTDDSVVIASSPVPYKTRQECLDAISALQKSIQAYAFEESPITSAEGFRCVSRR